MGRVFLAAWFRENFTQINFKKIFMDNWKENNEERVYFK